MKPDFWINNISSDSSFQKFSLHNFQKFNLYEVPMILVAHKDIYKRIVLVDYIMSVYYIHCFFYGVVAIYRDM